MKKMISLVIFSAFIQFAIGQTISKWKITDVEKYMAQKDAVLVINFWATFCKPCVAEIPSFIRITNSYKKDNVKLLLVSLDLPSYYPSKISAFVKKQHFNTRIVWLDETNADYFCPRIDKSWSGSIPSSMIVNTMTGYRKFIEEEMTAEEFEKELKLAIKG
ncbi:MAG: TlpA disulfide reductase family protein [Ferruginibacter sp.]